MRAACVSARLEADGRVVQAHVARDQVRDLDVDAAVDRPGAGQPEPVALELRRLDGDVAEVAAQHARLDRRRDRDARRACRCDPRSSGPPGARRTGARPRTPTTPSTDDDRRTRKMRRRKRRKRMNTGFRRRVRARRAAVRHCHAATCRRRPPLRAELPPPRPRRSPARASPRRRARERTAALSACR